MNRNVPLFATAAAAIALAVGCAAPQPQQPTLTKYTPPPGANDYVKALAARDQGNSDAAISDLEKALQVNPSLRMARSTLGEIYMERKDYDHAVPHLQAAADLDPYTLQNHYNLGLTFQLLNRLQESAMAYLRGIRLAPDDFKTNVNIGLVYFALGQLDPAVYYLEHATRIDPSNVRAWSNIGVVYDARGNLVLAEASYRKALELDANNESTLINLTANLIEQKRGTESVAIATQLVSVTDTPENRKRLGDAQTTAAQWDAAEKTYRSCMTKTNTDGTTAGYLPALNGLAEMYAARFEAEAGLNDVYRQQAIATWQQSLKLEPNQPKVTAALAKYQDAKVFR